MRARASRGDARVHGTCSMQGNYLYDWSPPGVGLRRFEMHTTIRNLRIRTDDTGRVLLAPRRLYRSCVIVSEGR